MAPRNLIRLLLIPALLLAAAVVAADPVDQDDHEKVIIIGDDDDRLVVSLDGSELTITTEDDGGTSVRVMDMEQIGMLVGEALEGMEDILSELGDMQFDVHLGNDNRLNLGHHDQEWELDLDEIMEQVGEALEVGLAEFDAFDAFDDFDTETWTETRKRDHTEDELRDELRALKAELRELRRELRSQRDGD